MIYIAEWLFGVKLFVFFIFLLWVVRETAKAYAIIYTRENEVTHED